MTKTDRSTLIATVLLGVLLYTVLRFAHDLNLAWDGSVLEPPPVADNEQESASPRISGAKDLRALLIDNDVDATAALDGYARWSVARGFSGDDRLFASNDRPPGEDFSAIDEATLVARSDAGDAAASQMLGARMLFVDSFRSIDFYRRAAEQGSTFALLRIGSLLEALAAVAAGNKTNHPVQERRVAELAGQGVNNSLHLTALGYVITAIRDGGPPIVDHSLLERLRRLSDTITPEEQVAVCEWSERTLVNIAKERARHGKPAVTTTAPPVFFALPELAGQLPCRQTAYPIETLMEFADCSVVRVRDPADDELDAYICSTQAAPTDE